LVGEGGWGVVGGEGKGKGEGGGGGRGGGGGGGRGGGGRGKERGREGGKEGGQPRVVEPGACEGAAQPGDRCWRLAGAGRVYRPRGAGYRGPVFGQRGGDGGGGEKGMGGGAGHVLGRRNGRLVGNAAREEQGSRGADALGAGRMGGIGRDGRRGGRKRVRDVWDQCRDAGPEHFVAMRTLPTREILLQGVSGSNMGEREGGGAGGREGGREGGVACPVA